MTQPVSVSIWWRVLALALPALAQQYLLFVIQRYDQFLAGRFSADHQAALTNANYLYWFISSYTVVVSAGASALVGRLVGAGDRETANRAAGQSLLLAGFFGILATIAGMVGGLALLIWVIDVPLAAQPIAIEYLRPLVVILAFQMIETGGIACLVGAGDTRTGLYVLGGVAAVNVPVAFALSTGWGGLPDLGFVGIAWGTAISHSFGGIAVLLMLLRGRSGIHVEAKFLLPDRELIRRLLRVSIPAAVDSMSIGICQFWFLQLVNRLGSEATAAHGIAIGWEALGYLSGAAFGTAATSLVSRNLGAGRPDIAVRSGWVSLALGGGTMVFMGIVFYTFAPWMCRLFSPNNEVVVAQGVIALRTVAFAMPALASAIVFTSALRGAGDTRVPVLFSWIGFLVVRIPLSYLLTGPMELGLFGAWLAMLADIWLRGFLFLWRFAGGKWQSIRV